MEAKIKENLIDLETKMKMVLDEQTSIKEANFLLAQELEVNLKALRNTN
jgi:hypothetical protein